MALTKPEASGCRVVAGVVLVILAVILGSVGIGLMLQSSSAPVNPQNPMQGVGVIFGLGLTGIAFAVLCVGWVLSRPIATLASMAPAARGKLLRDVLAGAVLFYLACLAISTAIGAFQGAYGDGLVKEVGLRGAIKAVSFFLRQQFVETYGVLAVGILFAGATLGLIVHWIAGKFRRPGA